MNARLKPQQLVLQLAFGNRVEGAEGFVHQEYVAAQHERPRQPQALLHPAGKLPRQHPAAPTQTDELERRVRPLEPFFFLDSLKLQTERHVAENRTVGQQRKTLKHHPAQRPAAKPDQLAPLEPPDIGTADQHASGGRPVEAVQKPQQRRFARTRKPHQHERPAFGNLQRHVVDT